NHPLDKLDLFQEKPVTIAITGFEDVPAERAFSSKAHAFVRKPINLDDFLAVVKRTVELVNPLSKFRKKLTNREFEIFKLVIKGYTSKEIATMKGISPRTIEKHKENLLNK